MLFLLFVFSLIVYSFFSLWLVVNQAKKNIKSLMILIPIVLYLPVSFYFTVDSILGYPTAMQPKEKFRVLSYVTDEKDYVYVWIIGVADKEPRSIKFPYSKEMHEQLEKAKGMMERGIPVIVVPKNQAQDAKSWGDRLSEIPGEYDLYIVNPNKVNPK